MEYASQIALGDHVRDPITKFEGVVVSKTQFLHGCARCCVQGFELDKDGKEHNLHFDEAQLQVVEAGKFAPRAQSNTIRPPGGPPRDVTDRPTGSPIVY